MTAPPTTTTVAQLVEQTTTTTQDSAEMMAVECPQEFCVVYDIADDAQWSDGSSVTAEDFVRTHQAALALPAGQGDPGYASIISIDAVDADRVRVAFEQPYGPWRDLFSRLIGPGDAGSGPFQIVDRVPGDRIVVQRLDDWWPDADPVSGGPLGDVNEITFVFIDDPEDMVDALEAGEIDVMVARPDNESLEDLNDSEGIVTNVTPGRFWEHIDFHHEDPMLSQEWVRRAIALGVDREAVVSATAQILQPDALVLDNTMFMTRARAYVSHYDIEFDPIAATQLLIDNGCERGSDGIFECDGTPLSFVWATTNDDPARRVAYDLVAENLAAIGIELTEDFRTPSAFVSSDFLFGGPDRWQLANFAWRAGDDPADTANRYTCGSNFNVTRYCSPEVDAIFAEAEDAIDPEPRQDLYNEADRLYLEDLATIPLYQKPELMAWTTELSGLIPNHTASSDLWNVAAWSGKDAIVVALPAEPGLLDPFVTTDDNANRVLATVMYGALGMDPSLAPLHVLVESAVVVEG